ATFLRGARHGAVSAAALAAAWMLTARGANASGDHGAPTATPIKHLVVLFQENVPFDRYFGVYPHALNPPGEPPFLAKPGTPTVNGLTAELLTATPNSANPRRLPRTQQNVCGSNHGYTAEQRAYDKGLVDAFVENTGNHSPGCDSALGMDYF